MRSLIDTYPGRETEPSFTLGWAINRLTAEARGSDISVSRKNNPEIFAEAEDYIKQLDLAEIIPQAISALSEGNEATYKVIEQLLQLKSPVDTASMRELFSHDAALNEVDQDIENN